jgi:hypothetical protein
LRDVLFGELVLGSEFGHQNTSKKYESIRSRLSVDSSMLICQEINSNGAFRFVVILLLIQFFNLLIQFFSFFFQGLVELLSILQYLDRNQTDCVQLLATLLPRYIELQDL